MHTSNLLQRANKPARAERASERKLARSARRKKPAVQSRDARANDWRHQRRRTNKLLHRFAPARPHELARASSCRPPLSYSMATSFALPPASKVAVSPWLADAVLARSRRTATPAPSASRITSVPLGFVNPSYPRHNYSQFARGLRSRGSCRTSREKSSILRRRAGPDDSKSHLS